jgi:4-hydroxy-tetrahydrodipicolinate reductase
MKIALIGYGKMGKTIETVAIGRGHELVLKLDVHNPDDFDLLPMADVAIEFSRPESAFENLKKCMAARVPVVCGTTGWLHQFEAATDFCQTHQAALFYASNYSVGVNIFFEINRRLAAMMNAYPMYDVQMTEIHHTQKLDAPSGTAISLAKGILENLDRKTQWVCLEDKNREERIFPNPTDILITAKRIDPAPGTHIVHYDSPIDSIEISHTAHSREGFATGAVLAAEWILGRQGVFSMRDMLGF